MLNKKDLKFLKNKNLKNWTTQKSNDLDFGKFKFIAHGIKQNNEVQKIGLDDDTIGILGYAQDLYVTEWQEIEKMLLKIPENCTFTIKGFVIRRKDFTGSLQDIDILYS